MSKRRAPRVRLVVVFDANMPKLKECNPPECREASDLLCRHRFPVAARVVSHTPYLEKPGLSDLQVTRHIFDLVGSAIQGVSPSRTRWILVSSDKKFWRSARHQYLSLNGHAPKPRLKFVYRDGPGRGAITALLSTGEVTLEVYRIKRGHRGPDTRLAKSVALAELLLSKRSS